VTPEKAQTINIVVQTIGAIIVSTMVASCFLLALVMAYRSKDPQSVSLLVGAIVTSFATMVGYWLGSSMSSKNKDSLIANSSPTVVVQPDPPKFPPPPKAVV
jgi:putative Ca2+/H+ antiporter (TMEM165/GDT1 family)